MFLDCVGVFNGKPLSTAMTAWKAQWPYAAYRSFLRLQSLSLVAVADDEAATLMVSPMVQLIGRSIAVSDGRIAGNQVWWDFGDNVMLAATAVW